MDKSLIEAVLEHHSRSHAAINCLQDQLHTLELLRNSAQRSFSAAQESGTDLEKSSDSLLRSSSRFLVPSPDDSPPNKKKLKGLNSSGLNLTDLCASEVSPARMRLSESQMSGFDVSAILAQVSPPRPFANGVSPLPTSKLSKSDGSAVSGDELLGMLEKISLTGHQLQAELENAKAREVTLIKEIQQLKSKENGFHRTSPTKSLAQSLSCPVCTSSSQNSSKTNVGNSEELTIRCDKLQDAMLSLQDENMKLNRLLRQQPHTTLTGNETPRKTIDSDHETSRLRLKVEELSERLVDTEMTLTKEREKLSALNQSISSNSRFMKDAGTLTMEEKPKSKYCEVELENLCSRLQVKADTLQEQNTDYLQRIRDLERNNNSNSSATETYNLRIDDLHKVLLTKDNELRDLRNKLNHAFKELDEKDKKTEKLKSKDITKRKEVLLLCEKYDQLKKNVKRLEFDLRDSQKKLQESTTKTWALETSCQRNSEENEILRHQLRLHESFIKSSKVTKNGNGSSALLKDYERLTEKYEALLDLRLREYQRVRVNAKNKRVMKQINIERGDTRPDLRRALIHEYEYDNRDPIVSDLMMQRQKDFRRFYARENPMPRLRSQSAEEISFTPRGRGAYTADVRTPRIPEESEHNRRIQVQSNIDKDSALRLRELENSSKTPKITQSATSYSYNQSRKRSDYEQTDMNNNFFTPRPDDVNNLDRRNRMTSTPVKDKNEFSMRNQLRSNYEGVQRKDLPGAYTPERRPRLGAVDRVAPAISKTRSRSLSPVRTNEKDNFAKDTSEDYRPESSRDSQKSVSFQLNGTHRRSKSTNSILDVSNGSKHKNIATTSVRSTAMMKKGNISPVEVLERVKSAYQEEYLQNMRGVDIIISPQNSPPILRKDSPISNQKISTASAAPSTSNSASITLAGAALCADRYRKSTESVKVLLEKSYGSEYDTMSGRTTNYEMETKSKLSTPPKSILKKPKMTGNLINENTPLVVREKFPHKTTNVNSKYDLSPPEMFRDSNSSHENTGSRNSSSTDDTIEIVDVCPKSMENGTITSLISSSNSEAKDLSFGDIPKSGSNAYKHYQEYTTKKIAGHVSTPNETKTEDLTIPIQLAKSMKDDDTDSLGQSSVSSTRDHIGRFEFLQEMQTTLKNPSFAYQKPQEENFNLETARTDVGNSDDAKRESDIGLSARQQEYADKLIKKYMKKSSGN